MTGTDIPPTKDTGLQCLIMIARFHQLGADQQQIKHKFGHHEHAFSDLEILRAAKAIDLKAKQVTSHFNKLDNASLPAIAKAKDGTYFIIARIDQKEESSAADNNNTSTILIQQIDQHSDTTPPKIISPDELEQLWSGDLILLKRQGSLFNNKKFDISWFIPSLVKYRKYFKEVLIVSFFLQLFALVTPLFFQVVMDKVLVHKGLTTLDVLALGFFAIAIFDMILGGLRNYIFAHTANRFDVELGAKLFHHLLSLPLGWFESRRWGKVWHGSESWTASATLSPFLH